MLATDLVLQSNNYRLRALHNGRLRICYRGQIPLDNRLVARMSGELRQQFEGEDKSELRLIIQFLPHSSQHKIHGSCKNQRNNRCFF